MPNEGPGDDPDHSPEQAGTAVILLLALVAMAVLALAAPLLYRRLGRDTGYLLAAGFAGVGGLLATGAPTVLDGGG